MTRPGPAPRLPLSQPYGLRVLPWPKNRKGEAILQRHPYEDLRVWQSAIGFFEMIYHETADFPERERNELGRRLRDAAFDWIYDLSMAHAKSESEFVDFLKSYHLYRTRLIILLKLGFRVGLIDSSSFSTLEGDLMEQEKVVQHQIELLESGRGTHTGALTSRSVARQQQVQERDSRRSSRSSSRSRSDRGRSENGDSRSERSRSDRDDSRSSRSSRDADDYPSRSRSRRDNDDDAPRKRSGRRVSSREDDESRGSGYPEQAEEKPARSKRRASTRSLSSADLDADDDADSVEEKDTPRRTTRRRRRAAVADASN